jgi:hypothetical protein
VAGYDEARKTEESHHGEFFDLFIHEAEVVNTRTDWFLVFHAILLEAFFSAEASRRVSDREARMVAVVGIATSFLWLMIGWRELWNVRHLARVVRRREVLGTESAQLLARFYQARRDHNPLALRWAKSTPAFCVAMPALLLYAWSFLGGRDTWGWAAAVCGILVVIVPLVDPEPSDESVESVASPGVPMSGSLAVRLLRDWPLPGLVRWYDKLRKKWFAG